MSEPLRILILEDLPTDAELMLRELQREGIEFEARRVETEAEFRRELQELRPGLILSDYRLPSWDGLSALELVHREHPDLPFILVSGAVGEELAVESLHHGATDYILKERLSRLGPAVRRAVLETEEKDRLGRAELSLRDSELRYRRLFEAARDGVLILDAETGSVVDVNPFLIELLSLSRAEFLARKVWELGFFKDLVANEAHFEELKKHEYIRYEDKALETRDGRRIDVEFISNVYLVDNHKVIQCNIRDISERRRLESQIRQAQKMESVGRLAGGIAHDFNNLLTVILGTVDLALAERTTADPLCADLQEVRQAAEQAARLTRQLLAFSRRQILQPRILNLNEALAEMMNMLQRLLGEDVAVAFIPETDLDLVQVDPGQIEQVVANLAINARDAMPDGGTLTIETRNVTLDEAYAAGHPTVRPGPHVLLTVSDTGLGMDEATRLQIFEPFFTTKGPGRGTGLGLSTVYGIVKQSGGTIWVDSEPGRGSCFRIYMPRAERASPAPAEVPAVTASRGSETILVVEDENALRGLARRFLETAGYEVLAAANGGEALALLEHHAAPVDLVLTDLVMPEMGGRELAKRLSVRFPKLKIVFTSGYTDEAILHQGPFDDGTPFLAKPYTVADLRAKVREVLDAPGDPPAAT